MQTTESVAVNTPETEVVASARKGPELLDVELLKLVAGGSPHGVWSVQSAQLDVPLSSSTVGW